MFQTKEIMMCMCMFAWRMEVSDNVRLGFQIHQSLQPFWMIVDSSLGCCIVNRLISPGRAPLTSNGWKSHLWIKGNLQPANSVWICFRSLSIILSVIIFALFSCTSCLHRSKRCRRPIYVLHAVSVFLTGWDRSLQCIFKVFALLSSQCPDLMVSSTSLKNLLTSLITFSLIFTFFP